MNRSRAVCCPLFPCSIETLTKVKVGSTLTVSPTAGRRYPMHRFGWSLKRWCKTG